MSAAPASDVAAGLPPKRADCQKKPNATSRVRSTAPSAAGALWRPNARSNWFATPAAPAPATARSVVERMDDARTTGGPERPIMATGDATMPNSAFACASAAKSSPPRRPIRRKDTVTPAEQNDSTTAATYPAGFVVSREAFAEEKSAAGRATRMAPEMAEATATKDAGSPRTHAPTNEAHAGAVAAIAAASPRSIVAKARVAATRPSHPTAPVLISHIIISGVTSQRQQGLAAVRR
mmetsp:Transcript_18640/g.74433  ORF Transcript_18640/g.74433 Transcript_18640/m.74433 type:complete len:237 (-) Transcript_18640:45-755(-)